MKKLAIAQIVLGILAVGSLVAWNVWVSPGYHIREGILPDGNTIRSMGLLKANPLMGAWTVVYLVLGLSVFGCGLAQLVKATHKPASKAAELESGDENRAVMV